MSIRLTGLVAALTLLPLASQAATYHFSEKYYMGSPDRFYFFEGSFSGEDDDANGILDLYELDDYSFRAGMDIGWIPVVSSPSTLTKFAYNFDGILGNDDFEGISGYSIFTESCGYTYMPDREFTSTVSFDGSGLSGDILSIDGRYYTPCHSEFSSIALASDFKTLSIVPLPATLPLLGAGALGLFLFGLRRRARKA